MSVRRPREVYARGAVQLRTHERAIEAERQCPGAMGLYFFLLLQARGEQTWGDVAEAAALTSWGAPVAFRRKQLAALVAVGLVEQREDGRIVIARYGEHNDTPDVIASNREGARQRKAEERVRRKSQPPSEPPVTCDRAVTHGDVTSSSSSFNSLSGSGSDPESRDHVPVSEPPSGGEGPGEGASPDAMPPWFSAAATTVASTTNLTTTELPALWLEYLEGRRRKGWAVGERDAVGWLTSVLRSERSRSRRSRARVDTRQPLLDPANATWLNGAGDL